MNALADLSFTMHGRMGDFWTEKFPDAGLRILRVLSSLHARTGAPATLLSGMATFSGDTAAQWAGKAWKFRADEVIVIGPYLQKRIRTLWAEAGLAGGYVMTRPAATDVDYPLTGHVSVVEEDHSAGVPILQTEALEYWLMPSNGGVQVFDPLQSEVIIRYAVPIPSGQFPTALRSLDGREYVAGVDFRQSGELLIFSSEHPDVLFPRRVMVVPSGWEPTRAPLNYTLGLGDVRPSSFPAEYYRQNQSAGAWLRAMAVACGMIVMEDPATIMDVQVVGATTYYTTDREEVFGVNYPHQVLTAGDTVERGDILGNSLSISCMRYGADLDWWSAIDWSEGLPLDALCPFSGLIAPNASVGAYYVGTYDGSYHIRFPLVGDEEQQDKYWAAVHRSERLTGKFLNTVVGVSSPSDIIPVNPLRLLFEYGLRETAWVVQRYDFAHWSGDSHRNYFHFLHSERPFGAVIIQRDTTT